MPTSGADKHQPPVAGRSVWPARGRLPDHRAPPGRGLGRPRAEPPGSAEFASLVAPCLDPGEAVWLVIAGLGEALVGTERRLFRLRAGESCGEVIGAGSSWTYGELGDVRVAGERGMIRVEQGGRARGPLTFRIDDTSREQALQSVTVLALLLARVHRARRERGGDALQPRPGWGRRVDP